MTDNRTTELLPCPFCSGEAYTRSQAPYDTGYSVGCYDDECRGFIALSWIYKTEAKAIAAWNTRAPVEYDDWFYLPKPKKNVVQYSTPLIEKTEIGYRVEQPVEVIENAIRSWGNQLGEHIMKRLCEMWCTSEEMGGGTLTAEQIEELRAERDEWKTKCETREFAYNQADAERKRYSEQIDELRAERNEWKAKAADLNAELRAYKDMDSNTFDSRM